ncbi:30S ribosomal protein S1 [Salinibacter altiplanensis]|uniref:30S ribosomal protein S1 n=1 Tax=Salinibacter altiplanensis TaxID=1803181 RepID=UPI000C9FCCC7|nr:30S ribosomal protein S1 [Salinibacter altiplanensis]
MAEQEQVAPKDDSQDTADAQASPPDADAADEAEATAPDAENSGTATEATDAAVASTPDAEDEDADEPAPEGSPSADDGPVGDGGDGAPEDPPEEPGFVSRILEEAVEEASEDLPMPSGEQASVDVSEFEEPTGTVSPDELERTEEAQGFTGEAYGETVSLDDLEAEGQAPTDASVYDQFRDVVDETSIDVREQDIVEGRVLRVNEDYVVIDIGYKSDGIVSRDEFGEEEDEIRPGDTVEVYLERKEDRDGQLVLSKEQADKVRRWQRVEEIYENEEVIEGTIIRRIKGGMIVELFDGMEAFLPGSQIDVRPVRDFESYLETRMEFKIVKLNPGNENIVVSHRELIEHELEEQRQEILESLEVGQVLEGTVKNIVDFGVFIDLGGVDGLLHITDLSWGRVSHPSEVVELDQEIEVVVLDYEEERQRISLGLKQLRDHPWDKIGNKYDEDDVVEGKVVSITNYGAFVEIEKGIEGLVHISEMSWTRHIEHPSQMVSLGQVVDVKILNIDQEERKISLGMKQLEPDPWEGISDRYPAGTVLTGTVRNITNFGVFVEIEPGIDGLVHVSDLSWTKKIRHPGDMVDEEQELDVVILNIDEERRRISLGHKQVKTNPWDQFADAYGEGNDTNGEVIRVEDKGLVVQLPLDVEAFVPGSELKDGPKAFKNHYHEGDELDLRVIRFDKDQKDIVLSETAKDEAEREEEQQEEQRESRQKERESRQEKPEPEETERDFKQEPEAQPDEPTTGPTTLGELSGLADLRREMEEEEAAEEAAEAEVETPADEDVPSESDAEDASDAEATPEDEDSPFDETAGFPENFPRVSRLENADVTSLAEVREVDDLTNLDGIGSAYAEEISDALDEFDETGSVSD